jgi:hypothetical protein
MALPSFLKPKKNYLLNRFGRNNDGGYLVSQKTVLEAKTLVSFGILDDTSFELDFLNTNQIPNLCYDHSINKSYWKKRFFNDFGSAVYKLNWKILLNTFQRYLESKSFFKLTNIDLYIETVKEGCIRNIFNRNDLNKPIFFKIDIEGAEYRVLDELIEFQDLICGLVIEFHDIDLHIQKIHNFIKSFNLELTHIHPNNFGQKDKNGDPIVIELTFEKSPIEINKSLSMPNIFDQPNNPAAKDIDLKFI